MKSRPEFTKQQSDAILTNGVSIALSAGAGCGKTFVLTQRFLAGLDPGQAGAAESDLHTLVAITFTDRAAREMRDRIRAACHERLRNCPADQIEHWLNVLRGLDSARISTIHAFCASLLRSQAVEAGLDPRFTLLDPALADSLLERVVRDSFRELLEQKNDDVMQFVVQFGYERAQEILQSLAKQCFHVDFSKFADVTPEQMAASWIAQWTSEFVPKLIASFRESEVVSRTLKAIENSPSKNATMKERIANLNQSLEPTAVWKNAESELESIRENAKVLGGGGKKDWVSDEAQEAVKQSFEELRKKIDDLKKDLSHSAQDVATSAEIACRGLHLAQRILADYAAAKRAQGVLDFDDLLLQARNLLRDNESVRQRVAAGIRLLMVDEFQDTDPVQADLVRSLCGAALTNGRLFMVGDRKQSIYRFRRADPTVFTSMSAEIPEKGRLPLSTNFRSQPAVLNFVNHLFASAMEGYEHLSPFQNRQDSPTPAIEFLFAMFDSDGADKRPPVDGDLEDESDGPNASELRSREADWMARRIVDLLRDPTPRIRSKEKDQDGRPILRRTEPRDIVILFRALTNVQEYEAALRRYGLEYYLVGGKAFFAQQEVFDLLNLCRYLDDSDDLVGLVGVLRSPFFNLSDDTLQILSFHAAESDSEAGQDGPGRTGGRSSFSPVSLHESLYLEPPSSLPDDQRHRVRFAAQVLTELQSSKDRIPLSKLLNLAIERTGYDASLLVEFLGERKLANLRKLVEMARQFEQGDFATLKDFVARLQTSVLEETNEEFATTIPESGKVIRLMSIHQSKGLEFPVVFVADIDRKRPPQGGNAVMHPELGPLIKLPAQFGVKIDNLGLRMHSLAEKDADAEETIRLFYVACTRAADYLILSCGYDDKKKQHSPWMELIESRFDIRKGLLKNDPLLGSSPYGTAGRDEIPEIKVHLKPCEAKVVESSGGKRIPVGEIPGRVLSAEPAEFPVSARIVSRDFTDLPFTSVSQLEAIDDQLTGGQSHRKVRRAPTIDEEFVDVDMATVLGTLVHTVLERVDFRETATWADLLDQVARQSKDVLSDDVVSQARSMLQRFFESPLPGEFANAKSISREIDFMIPWSTGRETQPQTDDQSFRPAPLIVGIIDLLVETDRGWHILDYKTGEFSPGAGDQQLLAPYELQLGLYAHAVEQWFGATPSELSLIVFKPTVRRITLPWSAARWEKIRKRVNRAIEAMKQEPSTESGSGMAIRGE